VSRSRPRRPEGVALLLLAALGLLSFAAPAGPTDPPSHPRGRTVGDGPERRAREVVAFLAETWWRGRGTPTAPRRLLPATASPGPAPAGSAEAWPEGHGTDAPFPLLAEAAAPPPQPAVRPPRLPPLSARLRVEPAEGPGALVVSHGASGPDTDVVPLAGEAERALAAGSAPEHAAPGAEALAVEPAAGTLPVPTPRRDPLDVPLREEERWQEWLAAVVLNGEKVSEGAYVIRDFEGRRFAVPVEEARRWRLRVPRDAILTFQGQPFVPLDALPGAEVRFDEESLVLDVRLDPRAFEPTLLQPPRQREAAPATIAGAFFDYDLSLTAGSGVRELLDGLFELGAFGSLGVFTTSLALREVPDDPRLVRLESAFVRDFPERRTTLRVGDSITRGGSFAGSVRFFGVQYGTDFSLDPTFVTFPLPAIGGLAEQSSVVEVLVDNIRQASGEVPPGPFSFGNVPVLTGAGEVQLRVRDLLGREQLVTQRYYVSSRLLKAGLADWSVEAGFLRRRYGERSLSYGDPFLAGTVRYGLSDSLTGELHAEAQSGRVSAVAGGALKLGTFGVLTAAVGASRAEGPGTGLFAELGWEYVSRSFDVGLRTRYTSSDFRQFGDDGLVRRTDEARLGLGLGDFGRIGLYLARRDLPNAEDTLSGTLSWSLPLKRGSLVANAAHLFSPHSETALSLHYALPLGGNRLVSGGLDASQRDVRARASFRQGRGADDLGLDWRISGELGEDVQRLDGRAEYQGRHGRVGAWLELVEDGGRVRLDADGTLAFARGHLLASRRIGPAFGLVALPGLPGVRVYLDHREVGRTDGDGVLLVPGLRPYEDNRLQLALEDLPLGVTVERPEVVVAPVRGGAVLVDFGVRREREGTARLLVDGGPLPAGLELASADGRARALVGRDGFAHLRGLGGEPTVVEGEMDGRHLRCRLPAPPDDDPLPDLGEIPCESV